jgi:hypothetical protein
MGAERSELLVKILGRQIMAQGILTVGNNGLNRQVINTVQPVTWSDDRGP